MMSDFMLWLYANYIRPQLHEINEGDYVSYFQDVTDSLPPELRPALDANQ